MPPNNRIPPTMITFSRVAFVALFSVVSLATSTAHAFRTDAEPIRNGN